MPLYVCAARRLIELETSLRVNSPQPLSPQQGNCMNVAVIPTRISPSMAATCWSSGEKNKTRHRPDIYGPISTRVVAIERALRVRLDL